MMPNGNDLETIITYGFLLAGAWNVVGILLFSRFFTNRLLATVDPVVFSWLGQVSIVLWGLAYCSVAKSYHCVPWLLIVFFVEKMIYGGTWLKWLIEKGKTLPKIASESFLTAAFYSIYGAGDLIFGFFFGWVALRTMRA
jgi:hypothetical protein